VTQIGVPLSRTPPPYARPAADDEVALAQRPLVPTVERHLEATAECPRDRFHLHAREHRAVNRDRLPPSKPLGQRGRARELGQLVVRVPGQPWRLRNLTCERGFNKEDRPSDVALVLVVAMILHGGRYGQGQAQHPTDV